MTRLAIQAFQVGLLILWMIAPLLALDGRVVLNDGTPAADATVAILGHTGTARTDREGRFTWQPDPPVPFEVLVLLSSGQYLNPVLIEEIPETGRLLIRVSPVAADSVTVTTGVTPNIDVPAANGTTVLGGRDLRRRQPERLVDALENIPGVSRSSEGHAAVPTVRGLAAGRTLLLVDSGRVTTERRAGPSASYLDPFFLEGIEVARGPGAVAYGSDAFGGIVHARSRRPEIGAPFLFRFHGSLGAGIPQRNVGIQLSQGFSSAALLFEGSFRQFDDYDSPLGKIDNSGARSQSLAVRGEYELGEGRFSAGWQSDHGRDIGRPRNNSNVQRFFYPREDSDRLTASYDLDPVAGFSRLKVDAFIGTYRLVTNRDRVPRLGSNRTIESADVRAKDFGVRALAIRPLKRTRIEFGVDLNGRFGLEAFDITTRFDGADAAIDTTRLASIENARKIDGAVFGSIEYLLSDLLTVAGGLRFDRISTRNRGGFFPDRATDNSSFSGFASVTVSPIHGLLITPQISRGFRDPTLSDRYFRGVTGRGFITGNPDLRPETSRQLDLAVRYSTSATRWAFYAYRYTIDDLVERFESGTDLFFFRNRGTARLRGVELEAQWDVGRGLTLEAGAQTSSGRALDDDQPLDDIPARNLSLVLREKLTERGYLQIRGALFDRDESPGPTERVVPGYGLVDIGGGWQIDERLGLTVQVRNLFDKDYPVSPDERAILAPGLSGLLTLTVEF